MAGMQQDIEQIVREVVLRLQQQAPQAASRGGGAPQPEAARRPEPAARAKASPPDPSGAADSPQKCLDLSDRVVTLELLSGRLQGIRKLHVRRGSVVTPAVRDELRKRGIRLERTTAAGEANSRPGGPPSPLLVAAVTRSWDPAPVLGALAAEFSGGEPILSDCVFQATCQLVQELNGGGRAAVLLTSRPLTAVCLANRQPSVRAAWVADPEGLQEALRGIGANLLVLDPKKHSRFELLRIVRSFARADHVCPEGAVPFLGR